MMPAAEPVAAAVPLPARRLQAIDWLRGLVMILMTVDHAGNIYDAHHLHGDSARHWTRGELLPAGEFLTRWITHLCAPTFVLLAGAALALSSERRRGQPGQTGFIVRRGLFIALLDPLWMSLGFALYRIAIFQVLFAIGMSLLCMAWLRRLPSRALLGGAIAIQLFGELSARWNPQQQPLKALWIVLFTAADNPVPGAVLAYPLVPWLSMMMAGWVLGRWLLETRDRPGPSRAPRLAAIGVGLLAVFAIVRGVDGYGNWGLYRDSLAPLQWLHVAKYPPSLSYTTLELGLAFLLLALFFTLDDGRPRRWLQPLGLFGSTAFFFYLLHVHLLGVAAILLRKYAGLDPQQHGLPKTWIAAALVLVILYPACAWYRRYKTAHPDGWTRYI